MRRKHLNYFLCLSLTLILGAVSTLPSRAGDKVTVVAQKNLYMGPSKLYLAPDKAKLLARNGQLVILCAPPSWKVLVWRKDENSDTEVPLDHWASHGFGVMPPHGARGERPPITAFDKQLKIQCTTLVSGGMHNFYENNDPLIFRTTSKAKISKVTRKFATSIPLSENMKLFIRGLYNQHRIESLPLELTTESSDGRSSTSYSTLSISKETVADDFWKYATKYTVVPKISDVFASQQDVHKLGTMLKGIMSDDRSGAFDEK